MKKNNIKKFKDGEILAGENDSIFIYNPNKEDCFGFCTKYLGITKTTETYLLYLKDGGNCFFGDMEKARLANKKEKEFLFEFLERSCVTWDEESKTFTYNLEIGKPYIFYEFGPKDSFISILDGYETDYDDSFSYDTENGWYYNIAKLESIEQYINFRKKDK